MLRFGVSVLFGHAKVDHVNDICSLGTGPADKEIVGLDVTVDQVLFVYRLYPRQLTIGQY